jgi:hypothetical protein
LNTDNQQYENRNYFKPSDERMVDFEKFIRRYESKFIDNLLNDVNILSFL